MQIPYQLTIHKNAIKSLEKINDPFFNAIKLAIFELSENPRPYGYIKLKGRNAFRIRVLTYRIIYEINDLFQITVLLLLGK